ncbi:polycystin-1-like protein 1 [Thomomys bottae]
MGTDSTKLRWWAVTGALALFTMVQSTPGVSSVDGNVRRSLPGYQSIQNLAQGVAEAKDKAKGISKDPERCFLTACCASFCGKSPGRAEESQGLHLCTCMLSSCSCQKPVEVQPNPDFFVSVEKESRSARTWREMAGDMEPRTPYLLDPLEKNNLKTSLKAV